MSKLLISSFLVSDVSESLRSLTKNEWCERIAQVAHQKWATEWIAHFFQQIAHSLIFGQTTSDSLGKPMSEFPALQVSYRDGRRERGLKSRWKDICPPVKRLEKISPNQEENCCTNEWESLSLDWTAPKPVGLQRNDVCKLLYRFVKQLASTNES